jgi:ABC-type phosphate/phosphonate transport system substrate-binding protein
MKILPPLAGVLALVCAAAAADKLVIGVNEPICKQTACSCVADLAIRSYAGLIAHVRQAADIELEFKYYEEPLLLQRELNAGRLDGLVVKAWMGLCFAKEAGLACTRLADITLPKGEPQELFGLFIVPKESPLKQLADLQGKRLVLGPTNAYEKSYLVEETLRAAKLAVNKSVVFKCQNAAVELIEQRADAAVISSYALAYGCINVVADPKEFRVIGETKRRIPFVTFMVADKVAPALRARLQKALLELKGDKVPADLLSAGVIPPLPWTPEELGK